MIRDRPAQQELGAFLRERRAALAPFDVHLPPGRLRRSGLTQEQVAELVGVSRQWYIAFENGRLPRPTLSLVRRVAEALRLHPAQTDHLLRLASAHELPAVAAYAAGLSNGSLEAAAAIRNLARRCGSIADTTTLAVLAAQAAATVTKPSYFYAGSIGITTMTFIEGSGALQRLVGTLEPNDNTYSEQIMAGQAVRVESLLRSGVARWVNIATTTGARSFMAQTIYDDEKPILTFGIAHDAERAFTDYEVAIMETARAIAELTLR